MAKKSQGNARANRSAEQLGRMLGQAAARVDSLKAQREELRGDLAAIIEAAKDMMDDLGVAGRTSKRAGKQAGRAIRRAGKRVSATARARMAAAARKRWARERAKKGT